MKRLLLWDIDGTLINDGGSFGRDAFHAAVVNEVGRDYEDGNLSWAGKTDPQVFREIFNHMDVPTDDVDRLVKRTLRSLAKESAKRQNDLRASGTVMPGVRGALERMREKSILNTVLTGNIAVNAVLKLETFHLTKYFDFEVGAFGSDREARSELVPVALKRADDLRNLYFDEEETWIIGDTPHDLAAARANDIKCVLVASGSFTFEELKAARPDAVLESLNDADALYRIICDSP